jgi:hypothetical protein
VRLYRVTKNKPPVDNDMKSHWDLGYRPSRPSGEAAYKEVSTFDTAERAAAKARARDLGEYVAELEIPDETPMSRNEETGHRGLQGMTPEQLLGCVQDVRRVDEIPDGPGPAAEPTL